MALRVFPRRIRKGYGEEMVAMFAATWKEARRRGAAATARALARTLRDLAVQGGGARLGEIGRHGDAGRTTMGATMQDVGQVCRGLLRRPGFTLVAVMTLALGIGANTAIFSIVDAAWLDPLPFPDDERLVVPYNVPDPSAGGGFAAFSHPFFLAFQEYGPFESVTALSPAAVNVGGEDRPERVTVARVTGDFFGTTGVSPVLGRGFTPEDDAPGAPPAVVLGHGLWTRRFGADPDAVGGTLVVDGRPAEILGVMPPDFELLLPGVELWITKRIDPAGLDATSAVNNNSLILARLDPDMTRAGAEARLTEVVDGFRGAFPDATSEAHEVRLVPLREHLYGDVRPGLTMLLGSVGLVLLIACANLANLLLVRAESRRRELAVRSALGASRGRLVGILLSESVILALAGGLAGALLGSWALELVRPLAPANVPLPSHAALDGGVFLFTLAVSLATGVIFGLIPAARVARRDLRGALVEGGRGSGTDGRAGVRGALVVSEVALTAVLLLGSGLLLHSLWKLRAVDPGFRTEDRVSGSVALPADRYGEADVRAAFYRSLVEELEASPGVRGVGLAQWLPLGGTVNWGYEVRGQEEAGVRFADYNLVSPGWLDAMGMEVVEGRGIRWSDLDPGAPPVVLVSQSTARGLWPGESAVGRLVNVNLGPAVWREVVGVVSDVRNRSLSSEPGALLYFPPVELPMASPRRMTLVVHYEGGAPPAAEMRRVLGRLDPAVPLSHVRTLAAVAAASEGRRRFLMTLLGTFTGVALLLAAVGLYGVVSYTFSLRTREIGLRMAVGAGRGEVLAMVLGQSGKLVGTGIVLGLAGGAALARVMEGFLYEVEVTDLAAYGGVVAFLVVVAGLAVWLPARRATGVDPATVLRGE
jgi:predicted permease